MLLSEILNTIPVIQVVGIPELVDIKRISIDSRDIENGSLFVAIKGFKVDGHKFIPQAVSNGVSAVVVENDDLELDRLITTNNIVKIVVGDSRDSLALISDRFFGKPSSKLNLIGITGTKGKTTTSYYLRSILNAADRINGLIGTNKNIVDKKEISTKLTTPEAHIVNDLLNQMVQQNCTECVMEVSSHSLVLSRVAHLDFNVGVFTNITSDHLDFHSTFENYLSAKKILFDNLNEDATIIYNTDDPNSLNLLSNCKAKQLSYGIEHEADLKIENVQYDLDGTRFEINYSGNTYNVDTKLIGLFNAYNSTAAIGAALSSGIDINVAIKGIYNSPQVPGRFEVLGKKEKKVIIDYSHTSDSLKQALQAIKHIVGTKRPIYTVFGCGGDRDKTKRPIMGKISEEYSDFTYLTSDNPRSENPYDILKNIESGMNSKKYKVIEDREEAIKRAIEDSEQNAVILIAGKGHENYQEINGVRHHFSDKEIAEKYM